MRVLDAVARREKSTLERREKEEVFRGEDNYCEEIMALDVSQIDPVKVALARMLFPMEARVVMDIAQVDGTLEFTLASAPDHSTGSQRSTTVDLNETPFKIKEEHLSRIKALSRTVELGKQFFLRFSEVLNKIMDDDDLTDIASSETTTPQKTEEKDMWSCSVFCKGHSLRTRMNLIGLLYLHRHLILESLGQGNEIIYFFWNT